MNWIGLINEKLFLLKQVYKPNLNYKGLIDFYPLQSRRVLFYHPVIFFVEITLL
jgi:hypothetical protein